MTTTNELPVGEAHAHAILNAALDAVVTIDHLGTVLEFNRAAERIFGFRKEDVLGRELAALIVPPEHREAHRKALERWSEDGRWPRRRAAPRPPHRGRGVARRRLRLPGGARNQPRGRPRASALHGVHSRRHRQERGGGAPARGGVPVPHARRAAAAHLLRHVRGRAAEVALHEPADRGDARAHGGDVAGHARHLRALAPPGRPRARPGREAGRVRPGLRPAHGVPHARSGRAARLDRGPVGARAPAGRRRAVPAGVRDRHHGAQARGGGAPPRRAPLRTLVEQLPLTVYVDRVDAQSSNIYSSPQVEPLLGYSREEWASDPTLFERVLHPDDHDRVLAAHAHSHATGEPLNVEYRLLARDGRVVWVQDEGRVIADPDGGDPVLQGILLDVTARKDAEEQLRHQAFHDALTGLPNRALFMDRLEHSLLLHAEEGTPVAVLFVDLDDFKAVNDGYGHPAGDALLRSVGLRLGTALSPLETVARIGGDEFAVLVEDRAGLADVPGAAERLLRQFDVPFEVEGREAFVTASVGVAFGRDSDELLRCANVAMYRAKEAGARSTSSTPRA